MKQAAAQINAANAGVTASIISDSSGSRLSLTSATTGAAGELAVDASSVTDSGGNTVGFTESQQGAGCALHAGRSVADQFDQHSFNRAHRSYLSTACADRQCRNGFRRDGDCAGHELGREHPEQLCVGVQRACARARRAGDWPMPPAKQSHCMEARWSHASKARFLRH